MQAEAEHLCFGKGNDLGKGKKVDKIRTFGSKYLLCSPIFFCPCICFRNFSSVNRRVRLFLIFVLECACTVFFSLFLSVLGTFCL